MTEMRASGQTWSREKAAIAACPCCGGGLSAPFYEVGPVPVHSCLMLESAEAAAAFPQAHVRLAQCEDCGFVTNVAFDPKWSAYDPNYEDQQSFSPTFNSFAGTLAREVIERHGLHGKRVVEVGCSKGDFLRLLCEQGGMHATGIDPSVLPGRVPAPARGEMTFVPEYYGDAHAGIPADLICCRHTLEHIQDVRGTLALMHAHAARNPGCVLLIEVPDATRIWDECAFEDIYYEHCSYFTPGALARAVRAAGFAVTELRRDYGDQYLVLEATLAPGADRRFAIEEEPHETSAATAAFAARIYAAKARWRNALDPAAGAPAPIAIWGSGSKCVAFLKTLGAEGRVAAIVDINRHRHGRFAPGLGVPIQPPAALSALQPRRVVAMNGIYADEIRADLGALGVTAEVLAVTGGHQ